MKYEHDKSLLSSIPPSFLPSSTLSAPTVRITYTRQASVDDGLSALKHACHYPTPPPSPPPSPQGGVEEGGGRGGGRPDFVEAVLFRENGKKVGEVASATQVGGERGREGGREGGKGCWTRDCSVFICSSFPLSLPSLPVRCLCSLLLRPSTIIPKQQHQQHQHQKEKNNNNRKGLPPTPSPKAPSWMKASIPSLRLPSGPPSLPCTPVGDPPLICFTPSMWVTFTLSWKKRAQTRMWRGWTLKTTCSGLTEACFG